MVFGAQNESDFATSTEPAIGLADSATSTGNGTGHNSGTATSTEEVPPGDSDSGGQLPADFANPVVLPAETLPGPGVKGLAAESPAKETEIKLPVEPLAMAGWAQVREGSDDAPEPFAQILPPGIFGATKKFDICAVIRPGDNTTGSLGVYSQLSYPKNSAFAANDRLKRQGCGQAVGQICEMKPMEEAAGLELLCARIRQNNANLPVFAKTTDTDTPYDFDAVCAELEKQTAFVYCCGQSLAYDDLAGIYQAAVIARSGGGEFSNLLVSDLEYLPLSAVDIDFTSINYGSVAPNAEKIAKDYESDDSTSLGAAYIRNAGNTRLAISVMQNDMGLGQTNNKYNVRYRARWARGFTGWTSYWPDESATLPGELDLSENMPAEFAVTVLRYPDGSTSKFQGTLTISAAAAAAYQCANK